MDFFVKINFSNSFSIANEHFGIYLLDYTLSYYKQPYSWPVELQIFENHMQLCLDSNFCSSNKKLLATFLDFDKLSAFEPEIAEKP